MFKYELATSLTLNIENTASSIWMDKPIFGVSEVVVYIYLTIRVNPSANNTGSAIDFIKVVLLSSSTSTTSFHSS